MTVQKLVIPRAQWARGGMKGHSLLLNGEGARCCVGHYLTACGVEDELLFRRGSADDLLLSQIPEEARWLVDPSRLRPHIDIETAPGDGVPGRSDEAQAVYRVNDTEVDSEEIEGEEHREQLIKEAFARQGIEVEFLVDPAHPHGLHRCEECHRFISAFDIEAYSVEVDGIERLDESTSRWVPKVISIPRVCCDCAEDRP